ncbi:DUF952 domain-containing protein [Actinospongicola halichondriae]|uniref:DUF952 domain-containing protein n=1 Tax=Actinospongicola halichondriae TaxID=3236844 RepID=UPI003D406DD3
MSGPILHLALRSEWDAAVASGEAYDRSTIGVSLAEEGFIHCSFPDQVVATAERYYAGRDDVVVLVVDPGRVDAEVRVEDLSGTGVEFPHVYGPIPVDAVVDVVSIEAAAARR